MSKTEKDSSTSWTQETRVSEEAELAVPRHCTLDGFAHEATLRGGIETASLTPLTKIRVRTHNSHYQITLLDPGESTAIIQGGRFFVQPSRVYFCGSSYGGTLLKMCWIGNGMRMEIMSEGRRIVTSPVVSAETLSNEQLPGPF